MSRPAIYNMGHVKKVEEYVNKGIPKKKAILAAGYSDPSLFYRQIKTQKIKETVTFTRKNKPKHSFL